VGKGVNMTAKEMFDELGYELIASNLNVVVYRSKEVCEYDEYDFITFSNMGYYKDFTSHISVKMHQAITQQMKELGCIE
jgi:hypothetical protein